jgi:two-component system, NarL family, nitrate/nitrite response regulator NarL
MSLRCLIVDDSERFLDAASSNLGRNGIDVVGTATTSAAALDQVAKLRPDVVLVDVGLGEESGFDLTLQLVDAYPYLASRVVLISTRAEDDYGELVDASPAAGFIAKSELSPSALRKLVLPDDA